MKLLDWFIGDQLRAKYGNTKFYVQQFAILLIKGLTIFTGSMIFFLIFFVILTPDPTTISLQPVFEVKKSSENNMITIYTNREAKKIFCQNQSLIYYGKHYTKQQYCQFQHQNFPFSTASNNEIDIQLKGMNDNVEYVTACIIKVHEDRSVCQKFAYNEEVKAFKNLFFEELYSFQIELTLKKANLFFGQVSIQFQQQNTYIIKLLKQYYLIFSILTSICMSLVLMLSFMIFQIPEILEKGQKMERKNKQM